MERFAPCCESAHCSQTLLISARQLTQWSAWRLTSECQISIPPLQHQEYSPLPHREGSPGAHPGSCHLPPGLLQLPPCWCSGICHQTSGACSESCGSSGVQPPQVLLHNHPSPFSTLAPPSPPSHSV